MRAARTLEGTAVYVVRFFRIALEEGIQFIGGSAVGVFHLSNGKSIAPLAVPLQVLASTSRSAARRYFLSFLPRERAKRTGSEDLCYTISHNVAWEPPVER